MKQAQAAIPRRQTNEELQRTWGQARSRLVASCAILRGPARPLCCVVSQKIARIVMIVMADALAYGQTTPSLLDHKVTVCLQGHLDSVTVPLAVSLASKMFAGIGVDMQWRHSPNQCPAEAQRARLRATSQGRDSLIPLVARSTPRSSCASSSEEIQITFSQVTPQTLKPGALAYAFPYQGTHIEIFYDRIAHYGEPKTVSIVLAHVLVHEITHILEGIARHSSKGIMKARWDYADILQMQYKPVEFSPEDVALIHSGLAARTRRAMAAIVR